MRAVAAEPASTDTRSRIVAAAVALFAEQGYDATSVNQVVARAGVAKGALYHHFQSKDDLLYEVYRELVDRQRAGLAGILDRALPPADTLRAIVLDMVTTTAASVAEAKVFFREGHRLTDANQQRVRAARREIHHAVTELVRTAQRDGRFNAVASPEMVTFTVFGVINELPVWYSPDGAKSPERLAGELADLVLAGLAPRAARTSPDPAGTSPAARTSPAASEGTTG
ncbi:MAG TPA: TetR/AcrR family transcriptional regulator [Jatrophihabitans sp.]|nr:TetR/AcrR family transcriptional regulator [Jatrophihabitans sp.]